MIAVGAGATSFFLPGAGATPKGYGSTPTGLQCNEAKFCKQVFATCNKCVDKIKRMTLKINYALV
jgi:hypothetical protein